MRIDSANLPAAARQNSRVHGANTSFPGIPSEKANEVAATKRPDAENIAAKANAAEKTAKPSSEKLTPEGLLNAQMRLQAMTTEMNKGQTQALASINRNIARYESNQPAPAPETTPAPPPAVIEEAPATETTASAPTDAGSMIQETV